MVAVWFYFCCPGRGQRSQKDTMKSVCMVWQMSDVLYVVLDMHQTELLQVGGQ